MTQIEDKYFKLLHTYIYDKRRQSSGIISRISIMPLPLINSVVIGYDAYISKTYSSVSIFVEDFENGSVVFLLPFSKNYKAKELEEMAERHTAAIKEFFGDKFRDDMIMRISEEERQKEIGHWGSIETGLNNWEWFYRHKETEEAENGK